MLCSRHCAKPLTNTNTFNPPNNQRKKVILALPYRFRHRATGKLCNPSPSHYQYRHSLPEHCFLNSYPQQQSPGHPMLHSPLVSRKSKRLPFIQFICQFNFGKCSTIPSGINVTQTGGMLAWVLASFIFSVLKRNISFRSLFRIIYKSCEVSPVFYKLFP